MTAKTIAVIADVHVNLDRDSEFEQDRFLKLIQHIAQNSYDYVIFAGDLFDKARPSLEELKLVISELSFLATSSQIFIIAGNHEAVTRRSTIFDYINFNEFASVIKDKDITINHTSIRLTDWMTIKKYDVMKSKVDVLISHFRSNLGFIKEEVNTAVIARSANLVVLGDIHQAYSPLDNVHYCSSPYSTKFTSPLTTTYGYIELHIAAEANVAPTFNRVVLNLPSKFKISTTLSSNALQQLVNAGHMLKIEAKGTMEELAELPQYKNVQYIKTCITTDTYDVDVQASANTVHKESTIDTIVSSLHETIQEKARDLLFLVEKEL